MIQPTKEQLIDILDAAPEGIRDAFWSAPNVEFIYLVCAENHLSEERTRTVGAVVGQILLGLVHPEDLISTISKEVGIDRRISEEIAGQIVSRIFSPIAVDLNKTYGFHLAVPRQAVAGQHDQKSGGSLTPTKDTSSQTVSDLTPKVEASSLPSQKSPAPFVIHEHAIDNSSQQALGNDTYEGGLVRPSFYTPPSGDVSEDETPRANLEIGALGDQEKPQTTRVGKENARIVHYGTPEAPADPFSGSHNTPQTKPAVEKKDVPQSNVVNLKDLPQ